MTRNREGGFTAVELMLSMAVLGIIITSISGAMIVFLSNGAYTTQRDDHSGGAAILATYLDRDLASAESATLSVPAAPCGAGTTDVLLRWDEWTASPLAATPTPGPGYSAAYDLVDDGAGGFQLERWYCQGPSLLDHSVLVRGLSSADFSTAPSAVCGTGSTSLVLQLRRYADDSGRDYAYSGCLKGRLT